MRRAGGAELPRPGAKTSGAYGSLCGRARPAPQYGRRWLPAFLALASGTLTNSLPRHLPPSERLRKGGGGLPREVGDANDVQPDGIGGGVAPRWPQAGTHGAEERSILSGVELDTASPRTARPDQLDLQSGCWEPSRTGQRLRSPDPDARTNRT
jgi:hypothetical protein